MSHQLGPVATADDWSAAAFLEVTDECARIDMWVSNNPAYYRIFRRPSQGMPQNPVYVASAAGQTYFLSLDRLAYGIQFKSAVAGQPAVVLCELINASELPDS